MKIILFLHVLGAILFLGNVIITAFWKVLADRSGQLELIHAASRKVLLADYVFTVPGLLLLLGTGNYMAHQLGYSMTELNWASASNYLFALSGMIWLAVLIPVQMKMVRYSKESLEQGKLSDRYKRVSLYWTIFGSLATILPIIVLFLMTVKPF